MTWASSLNIRRARAKRHMDQLADLVSEGWSISAAARSMGLSQQEGSRLFGKIKAEMGWQAQ
nr:hypothetical protein [Sphingomonas sp. SCN 67-18]